MGEWKSIAGSNNINVCLSSRIQLSRFGDRVVRQRYKYLVLVHCTLSIRVEVAAGPIELAPTAFITHRTTFSYPLIGGGSLLAEVKVKYWSAPDLIKRS